MALSKQEFDRLVARLEQKAATNPLLYKLKLTAFASLGYFYAAAILLSLTVIVGALMLWLVISQTAGLLIVKIAIPVVMLILLVLRAMWVCLDKPQGLEVKRQDFSNLFKVIDEVRHAASAPRPHTVLITADFNAAIVQVPRLGLFGWQKNYLILGLPLLQLVTLNEFKAVLAHEFGHLSGAHGRFGAWIYRVRIAWARLSEALQRERHWASFIFVPFFSWYAPKFAAYSFVQARQQEYEADRLAADTMSPEAIAGALVRIDLKARQLEQEYWPSIYAQADSSPTPSMLPFRGLLETRSHDLPPTADEQLQQALKRKTGTDDTHPCLKDRLTAIDARAGIPAPVEQSAAEALLDDKLSAIVEHFDREWRADVTDWWEFRHKHAQDAESRLGEYADLDPNELNDDKLFDYAQLKETLGDPENAFLLYKTLFERTPSHTGAGFAYGRFLLERENPGGVKIIEHVMEQNPEAVQDGCGIIIEYLRRNGREDDASPYFDRLWKRQEIDEAAFREREIIHTSDTFLPPEMAPDSVAKLQDTLTRNNEVKRAYLVRKKIENSTAPLHILGIECHTPVYKYGSGAREMRYIQEFANNIVLDEELLFIPLNGDNKRFKRIFKSITGSEIYLA